MSQAPVGESMPIQIAERFAIPSPIRAVRPLGTGLINRTFLVETVGPSFVLQRINGEVFPRPDRILANLHRLTAHLRACGRSPLTIPALVPTHSSGLGAWDADGYLWRMLELVPRARVLPRLETLEQATAVGHALGQFHRLCAGLDPDQLAITLPGFHVTPSYLDRLGSVAAALDPHEKMPAVAEALDFIGARQSLAGVLQAACENGHLRRRVVHGDPKLDNILFDELGRQVIGLIDLDTVQPGLIHHDIGDCLRSACNRHGESGTLASFDLALCRGILRAYACETEGLLEGREIALLYDALRLIPLELGIRFLTDHLEGDRYFRVRARGENLDKAQIQLALVRDIEAKERETRAIIEDCFGSNASKER